MIRRRAAGADIKTKVGNHTFRATGITAYLKNVGTLENAAAMANHMVRRSGASSFAHDEAPALPKRRDSQHAVHGRLGSSSCPAPSGAHRSDQFLRPIGQLAESEAPLPADAADLVGALGDGRSGGNGPVGLAARPEKHEYSIQFGSHPENLR
jgi:hypothetical protein